VSTPAAAQGADAVQGCHPIRTASRQLSQGPGASEAGTLPCSRSMSSHVGCMRPVAAAIQGGTQLQHSTAHAHIPAMPLPFPSQVWFAADGVQPGQTYKKATQDADASAQSRCLKEVGWLEITIFAQQAPKKGQEHGQGNALDR